MAQQTYSAADIACFFIKKAHDAESFISNLKLQKLVYYAQAWHLAFKDRRLISDATFEAWVHGPVLPSLYQQYRSYRWNNISEDVVCPEFDADSLAFLEEVADVYMKYDAYHLEQMTHLEEPWLEARGSLAPDQPSSNPIRDETMRRYYRSKAASNG